MEIKVFQRRTNELCGWRLPSGFSNYLMWNNSITVSRGKTPEIQAEPPVGRGRYYRIKTSECVVGEWVISSPVRDLLASSRGKRGSPLATRAADLAGQKHNVQCLFDECYEWEKRGLPLFLEHTDKTWAGFQSGKVSCFESFYVTGHWFWEEK